MNKESKMKTYKYHYDAGHGWLEVDVEEIKQLKILDKISSYSYCNNGKVYLEEDCDFAIFANALNLTKDNIIDVDDGDYSIIREYNHLTIEYKKIL